ncbi:MAG: hypothetical protein JW808_10665 [Victivallales bacterium]|nr:hypothetical protein [Victivallales bacterium]
MARESFGFGVCLRSALAVLACFVLLMFLSSCSSRFMKTSPFYTGEIIAGKTSAGQIVKWNDPAAIKVERLVATDLKSMMDDDRVNIWPVFFKNFLLYSFLWPLAEINDVGWEFRPLVSVDNYEESYRILTGGWNGRDGSHYVLPLYVKQDKRFLSLPFSSFGTGDSRLDNYMLFGGYSHKDGSSYLFPMYYYDGHGSRLYTLLFSFAKDKGYFFPVYFYEHGSMFSDHDILPPFGKFKTGTFDGVTHVSDLYFFPLFNYDRSRRYYNWRNPVYEGRKFRHDEEKPEDLFRREESFARSLFVLPSLYFSSDEGGREASGMFFPFYFQGHRKYGEGQHDQKWLTVFPFYYSGHDKSRKWDDTFHDKEWDVVFPVYGYSRDRKDMHWNYLGLAGRNHKHINGEQYKSSYVLPFYHHSHRPVVRQRRNSAYEGKEFKFEERPEDYYVDESTVSENLFCIPSVFVSRNLDGSYSDFTVAPVFSSGFHKHDNIDSEWYRISPFYSYKRTSDRVERNYGILAGTTEDKIRGKDYSAWYLLPFYGHRFKDTGYWRRNPAYKGEVFSNKTRPKDFRVAEKTVSHDKFFFPSVSSKEHEDGSYSDLQVFPFCKSGHDARDNLDGGKEWHSIFPVYSYERANEDVSRSYMSLFGTASRKIESETYESSYLLPFYWYGYSSEGSTLVNPKYDGKEFDHDDRPDDYYLKTARKNSYVFPNYFSASNEKRETSNYTIFPFLFGERRGGKSKTFVPLNVFNHESDTNLGRESMDILLLLYRYSMDKHKTTEFIFPCYYSHESKAEERKVTNFIPFSFYEKDKYGDSFGTLLWLYTSKNCFLTGISERQALWYTYYNYQETPQKDGAEDYESSRILWKLYHREKRGDTSNLDLFPFISYSENNERTRFSFAYRLFSLEKGIEGTKVHLLYLPVWW